MEGKGHNSIPAKNRKMYAELGTKLSDSVAGSILYAECGGIGLPCTSSAASSKSAARRALIQVTSETTVAAAKRLYDDLESRENGSLCILNFASAKNPGGGFQNGAEAQEESLARASGLYACLRGHIDDFYEPNRRDSRDGLYSHAVIHSPNVPFFRTDDGALCPLWYASVITSPAPNAGVALKKRGQVEISEALHERCGRILRVAKQQGHTHLVLGAFGCGVFQNDPKEVAGAFDAWLQSSEFVCAFHHVVFAIPGSSDQLNSPSQINLQAFQKCFGDSSAVATDDKRRCSSVQDIASCKEVESLEKEAPQERTGRWRKKPKQEKGYVQTPIPKSSIQPADAQQRFEFFVVLDFEATCDEHQQPQPQEIIEFPLVLVDSEKLQIVDEFRSYVRPVKHPRLSAFCTNLTGIQQNEVDDAPEFREVFKQACSWLDEHLQQGTRSAALVTCGDWDLKCMLPRQCQTAKVNAVPKVFREWVNIKKTYSVATGKPGGDMKSMLDALQLPLVGHHHSGLDDSRNIAKILISLCRNGAVVDLNGWL